MNSLFGLITWYSIIIFIGSIIVGLGDGIKEAISTFIVMESVVIGIVIGVFLMAGGV